MAFVVGGVVVLLGILTGVMITWANMMSDAPDAQASYWPVFWIMVVATVIIASHWLKRCRWFRW